MHACSYAWSLPVTWQRWQSAIQSATLHANFMALCFIEPELLPMEVLHCGDSDFQPFFALVTLTVTRWPLYTNITHISRRYSGCAYMNFLRQGFRKLSSDRQTNRQTEIQTDKQTDTTEIICHAASRVVKNGHSCGENVATDSWLIYRICLSCSAASLSIEGPIFKKS